MTRGARSQAPAPFPGAGKGARSLQPAGVACRFGLGGGFFVVLQVIVQPAGVRTADALVEHAQREHRAALARRADLDAQHVEDVLRSERAQLIERGALDLLRQHRSRRLADGAAPPSEAHLGDVPILYAQVHLDTIAAQGIGVGGVDVGGVEVAVVARLAKMLQDVLAVDIVHSLVLLPHTVYPTHRPHRLRRSTEDRRPSPLPYFPGLRPPVGSAARGTAHKEAQWTPRG